MLPSPVDLRSDTVTRPTDGMREAMAAAPVGDDVLGEDPTVNALQDRVAAMFGKEAALFVPSGTMANLVAFLAQTRPGDAVLLSELAHPLHYESGNLAMVGGLLVRPLPGQWGILSPDTVAAAIDPGADHHRAPTTLVSIENTVNRGGGAIFPLEAVRAIRKVAHDNGLCLHCDGARMFNALVETNTPPAVFAREVDSLCFCFSKGLGAPVGSIVVGDTAMIDRAHRFRKMLGGGMRQVGVVAAAAHYALDHHVERLREDHMRASRFRAGIADLPHLALPFETQTNMVFFDVPDAPRLVRACAATGLLLSAVAPQRLRAVFHLDIDDDDVERAVQVLRTALG